MELPDIYNSAQEAVNIAMGPCDFSPKLGIISVNSFAIHIYCTLLGTHFYITSKPQEDPEDLEWALLWKDEVYELWNLPALLFATMSDELQDMRDEFQSINEGRIYQLIRGGQL